MVADWEAWLIMGPIVRCRPILTGSHAVPPAAFLTEKDMPGRVELFGVEIDPFRMDQAVAQVLAWVRDPEQGCRFVVTPNVDHVVMLQYHRGLQSAYRDAGMVLVDGAPVLWSSRMLRRPVPQRVAGSDLVPALFDAVT